MEINKIYNEDCLLTIAKMPDDYVDHSITSPPYNFNRRIHNGKYTIRSTNEKTKYNGMYHDALSMDEYFEWQKSIINELLRITKGYIFYNIQMLTGNKVALLKLYGYFAEMIKDIIIWDKTYSEPAMSDRVMNSEYEFIIIFSKHNAISRQFDSSNFERGTLPNIFRIKKNSDSDKSESHKAQFPVLLPRKILKMFTQKNELIYDPFMGSGTTAIACIRENRNFIGSEISTEYCKLANKRLEPYLTQTKLEL